MSVDKGGNKWYESGGEWLDSYWPELLQATGAGLIGLPGILGSALSAIGVWLLFVSGIGLAACGLVGGVRRARTTTRVKDERDRYAARIELLENMTKDMTRFYLMKLAEDLKLGETERITVYHHVSGRFFPFGRYSANIKFEQAGRSDYPDDQGCIGMAWDSGEAYINDLPDPALDAAAYASECQRRFKLPPDVTTNLTMKSRSYLGLRFRDISDAHTVGLIIVESTKVGCLNLYRTKHLFSNTEGRRLAQMLDITQYRRTMMRHDNRGGQ